MLFSYNWLQDYIKERLPRPKELEDVLLLHAFEVEGYEKRGKDWIFDIAVLPNRLPDAGNHRGMAREIAAICRLSYQEPKRKPVKAKKGTGKAVSVSIAAQSLAPRYTAFVIEGISVKPSPRWLKERIEAVGGNSVNTIVDLTNYVMQETGQPLHAFDYDQIQGRQMRVRLARTGETLVLLDDTKVALPEGALVIQDAKRLIDLAGIMGGENSAITKRTKNIVLQAATFEQAAIYIGKTKLGIQTQAAQLYANGLDPNATLPSLERAAELLSKLGGGKVVQIIDWYPRKTRPAKIALEISYVRSLLGEEIPETKIRSALLRIGCKVRSHPQKKLTLIVQAPTRRKDLLTAEDCIEEIGRLFGYENIKPKFPLLSLVPPMQNSELPWREHVRDILVAAGLVETYNYSFAEKRTPEVFGYEERQRQELLELENPLSEEYFYLRPNLAENLLRNTARLERTEQDIRLFEIGKAYWQNGNRPQEQWRVAGVLAPGAFYEAKGIVELLCERLGITECWFDDFQQAPLRSGKFLWNMQRSAECKLGNTRIGFVGEISRAVAASLKVRRNMAAFSLNLEALIGEATGERAYRPPSRFPASVRDIAVLVPRGTKVSDVLNVMETRGGQLVRDIDVFDMYEGERVPEGMKNLAFHIVYQSEDRTLTGKEVDALHDRIVKAIEENPEWEVRK